MLCDSSASLKDRKSVGDLAVVSAAAVPLALVRAEMTEENVHDIRSGMVSHMLLYAASEKLNCPNFHVAVHACS